MYVLKEKSDTPEGMRTWELLGGEYLGYTENYCIEW